MLVAVRASDLGGAVREEEGEYDQAREEEQP